MYLENNESYETSCQPLQENIRKLSIGELNLRAEPVASLTLPTVRCAVWSVGGATTALFGEVKIVAKSALHSTCSPLVFSVAIEYAIKKVKGSDKGLNLKATH
jgi:hypothetical protein